MSNIMNDLNTLGLNPFAVVLLAESVLKSPIAPMTVGRPQSFFFPVNRSDCAGWAGVRITVEAIPDDAAADRNEVVSPPTNTPEARLANVLKAGIEHGRKQAAEVGAERVRGTELVAGETPAAMREAIAQRVADLGKPTAWAGA